MNASVSTQDLIDAVAGEMFAGVDKAVEIWMAEIEQAFSDPQLTEPGRLQAIKEILESYKQLTGKTKLLLRRRCA